MTEGDAVVASAAGQMHCLLAESDPRMDVLLEKGGRILVENGDAFNDTGTFADAMLPHIHHSGGIRILHVGRRLLVKECVHRGNLLHGESGKNGRQIDPIHQCIPFHRFFITASGELELMLEEIISNPTIRFVGQLLFLLPQFHPYE